MELSVSHFKNTVTTGNGCLGCFLMDLCALVSVYHLISDYSATTAANCLPECSPLQCFVYSVGIVSRIVGGVKCQPFQKHSNHWHGH